MTKFTTSVEKGITTISRIEDYPVTPKQQFVEDGRTKKSAIYHPPIRSINYAKEYGKYNKLCGDVVSWKAGVPMSLEDFVRLPSDMARKEYLQSIFDKYKGISMKSIAYMFGITQNLAKTIIVMLNINFTSDRLTCAEIDKKFRGDVDACFGDQAYTNLEMTRRKALPDLPRYTYDELTKMDPERRKTYFKNLMDRYYGMVPLKTLTEFFKCSTGSVYRLIEDTKYEYSNSRVIGSIHLSNFQNVMDERFREEMMSKRCSHPSRRKSNTIDQVIEDIGVDPIVAIEKVDIVEEEIDHTNTDSSVIAEINNSISGLGAIMHDFELDVKIGESSVFSKDFEKIIASVFGDKASARIKIEKL